jgi:selenocysteine lyase/cysteine desulfurase
MKNEASAVEAGCMNFSSIFALGAATRLLLGLGVKNIQERILDLNSYLEKGLARIGAEVSTPLDRDCRSGITIIKAKDPAAAVGSLEKMGIMTAARGGGIRVSLHFYNNKADIDKLIKGLKSLGKGQLA